MTADTSDSKAADWWSANSYKYVTAGWTVGLCPAAKYPSTNNEHHPVDGGSKVTLRRMGKGSVVAMLSAEDEFYLHAVDEEDHKCFEASSSSKFASKGITDSGKCPASYNTVDKSVVVEQCPDGVTSIRYCSPINVTIATKGQAMTEAVAASGIKQFYLPDDPNPARSLHCNDMTADTSDSKAADWWSANSYKYITAGWTVGLCPAAKYPSTNNEYHPVDGGSKVTLRRMGKGSVVALLSAEVEFYLHAVDEEDHKCFEASSSSKFASKGITDSGKCPASYNTVDKSVVVEQ